MDLGIRVKDSDVLRRFVVKLSNPGGSKDTTIIIDMDPLGNSKQASATVSRVDCTQPIAATSKSGQDTGVDLAVEETNFSD